LAKAVATRVTDWLAEGLKVPDVGGVVLGTVAAPDDDGGDDETDMGGCEGVGLAVTSGIWLAVRVILAGSMTRPIP
jgi:hypothetical protein